MEATFAGTSDSPMDRRLSLLNGLASDGGSNDHMAELELNFMKAKMIEFEARLSQLHNAQTSSDDFKFANGADFEDMHLDGIPPPERVKAPRIPCKPEVNRIPWVPFKNLYLDEKVYAIDGTYKHIAIMIFGAHSFD